jgi:hypothetical protein
VKADEMRRQAEAQLLQNQRVDAMRGRMMLGMVEDGLRVLLSTAQGGEAAAQGELANLRAMLREVLREDDPREKIAVVRRLIH